MEGILFVLVTGCQWGKLPKCFPSSSTCCRRFDEWTRWGIFEGLWFALLEQLKELGHIDWREAAADAWFARTKKGDSVGNTKCGKGCNVVDIVDTKGTPLAVHITAANHNEVKLIEPTLDQLQLPHRVPEHLIYDRAADSDALRKRLMDQRGIELVCPHRKGRKRKPTQDGRACRKYKRRYKVERTHSWFHNFRRTIIRYETTLLRYTGWIHLACALITLRRL